MLDTDKEDGVKGGVRIQTAMVAAAYNTLNPRDAKLMDDGRMHKVMNLIADLALEGEAPDRFSKSCNIADFIKRAFEKDDEEEEEDTAPDPEKGEGEGEGDGKGEDKDDEGEVKDDKGEAKGDDDKGDKGDDDKGESDDPYNKLPAQADDTLFGKVMEGTKEDTPPKSLEELMLPNIHDHGQGGPLNVQVRGFKVKDRGKVKEYNDTVSELKGEIKAVINSLLFMNNHPESHIHGMLNGTLDPGSLHKLAITDMDEPRVFEQVENITGKKIAVSLLIDRSGSMGSDRMRAACKVATILIEALGKIDGIELNVHTHTTSIEDGYLKRTEKTGHEGIIDHDLVIHDIIAEGEDSRHKLVTLCSGYQNLDGYAIKHIGDRMAKDYPDYDEKIIFVISDGEPHSNNYQGFGAMRHVGDTAEFCRAVHKIKVFGIGVEDAFDNADGEMMYGEGNFIVLSDVTSSIKVMASFLRNVAVKQ
jgi:cobalamin biosynthesis protein CobT